MPRTNDRTYRIIDTHSLTTRTADNGEMYVEGYATTFNQRYTLLDDPDLTITEEIAPEAFDDADMTDVIMQYDHTGRVFARRSNGTLTLGIDEHGLNIRARLDGTEIGRQLYEEIDGGYTTKMSFGFRIAKQERVVEEDANARHTAVHYRITGIKKLYDVSAVSLPANDGTEISARSLRDGEIGRLQEEHLAAEQRAAQIKRIKIMTEV